MPSIIIYGASDDLVEVEGAIEGADEYGAYNGWEGLLVAPDGQSLRIIAKFGAPGQNRAEWTLTVENTVTYPGWPIRFGVRPSMPGDPAILIDVPEGTILTTEDEN